MTRRGTNTTKKQIKQLQAVMSQDEDFLRPLVATVVQEVLEAEKHRALHPTGMLDPGPEFVEALLELELPGNARQLENIVRQALVHAGGVGALRLHDLPEEILRRLSEQAGPRALSAGASGVMEDELARGFARGLAELLERNGSNLSRALDECEGLLLETALRRALDNQSRAAAMLGITPRSVYNKLRKLRLRQAASLPTASGA